MFYTVDHSNRSLHTVRPGSRFEARLEALDIGEDRVPIPIGDHIHSVFQNAAKAFNYLTLLQVTQGD